jgi:outer membrane protein assembly factor BamA
MPEAVHDFMKSAMSGAVTVPVNHLRLDMELFTERFIRHYILANARITLLVVLLFMFTSPLTAREDDSTRTVRQTTIVGMPLINSSPIMKTGFGGIGMLMFQTSHKDSISPPSVLMLCGLYSTNRSYALALPAQIFFNNDTYRMTAAVALSRVNMNFVYDIAGSDLELAWSELRIIYALEFSRRIARDLFLGLMYTGSDTGYRFDRGTDEQNDFTKALFDTLGIRDNFVTSLGLKLTFDSRDYPYYPTSGLYAVLRSMHYAEWLGSNNKYTKIVYDLRGYHRLGSDHILAAMLTGGHSVGDVPFDGYQMYGMRNTLRGYPTGKYRGRHMIGLQVEYRRQLYRRWGMVAFAGAGSIWGGDAGESEEVFDRSLLPSVGAGIRFALSVERKINIRLDYALGVDGNDGLYLGIMEAF